MACRTMGKTDSLIEIANTGQVARTRINKRTFASLLVGQNCQIGRDNGRETDRTQTDSCSWQANGHLAQILHLNKLSSHRAK